MRLIESGTRAREVLPGQWVADRFEVKKAVAPAHRVMVTGLVGLRAAADVPAARGARVMRPYGGLWRAMPRFGGRPVPSVGCAARMDCWDRGCVPPARGFAFGVSS